MTSAWVVCSTKRCVCIPAGLATSIERQRVSNDSIVDPHSINIASKLAALPARLL